MYEMGVSTLSCILAAKLCLGDQYKWVLSIVQWRNDTTVLKIKLCLSSEQNWKFEMLGVTRVLGANYL